MPTIAETWLKQGKQEGILEGIRRGKQEGIYEGKLEMAMKALAAGLSTETITQISGLSINEIRQAQLKMKEKKGRDH